MSVRDEIMKLYAEVDAAVAAAGPKCESTGRCCRFTEWGHVLYLSHLEAEILLDAAPAYKQPVSPDGCPFQIDKLCTAREPRPLGCRIYFCDPNYQETASVIMEDALTKLKRLAEEHDLGWRYAPLHAFLNGSEPRPPKPVSDRIPLTIT
jgi:Fe-S-cluster containining protein